MQATLFYNIIMIFRAWADLRQDLRRDTTGDTTGE